MVKRSFRVIFIQVIGLILNLVSMYILVGGMDPQTYSLVGIYNTISNLVIVFTQLGIETVIGRNGLYWYNNNEQEKLKEYISQAFFSRLILYVLLLPVIGGYLIYLNYFKYDSQYANIFFFFAISLLSKSLIDCIKLILKALGKYELAQIVDVMNQTIVKIVGIIVFIFYGSIAYMFVFAGIPIIIAIALTIYIRGMIDFKCINIKGIISRVKEAKYLLLKSYVDYFRQSADSVLVSLIFPAEIMGSYSVFKTIEQMCKSLVEGFFDVITQEMVRLKGKLEEMQKYERKMCRVRNVCIIIGFLGAGLFWTIKDYIITLLRLEQYAYIDIMILAVILMEITYILGKIEINVVSLLAEPKKIFELGIVVFLFTFVSYGMVCIASNMYLVLIQRITITLINSIIFIVFYRRNINSIFANSDKIL